MRRLNRTELLKTAAAGLLALSLPLGAVAATKSIKAPQASQQAITALQTRAENEIDRRVNTLTNLLNRITMTKHITQTDTATLTKAIQGELSSLPTLKSKIAADTDFATLKTDIQSIPTEYRVYRLIVPQTWLVAASDSILALTERLTTLSTALQARINQAQQSGQNVTALNSQITDINAKINAAKSAASSVEAAVIAVTPDQYNTTPTILSGKRDQLTQAVQGLQSARTEAAAIIAQLKAWAAASSAATPGQSTTTPPATTP